MSMTKESPATASAPFDNALQALQRLQEQQVRMAATLFQGWISAQVELSSLFWRLPAFGAPQGEVDAAVRQTGETLQANAEVLGVTLSSDLRQAMADAEELLGRPLEQPAPVGVAVHTPGAILAYCVRCKERRVMRDASPTVMKNGKLALKGACGECGSGMFKIGRQ